MDEIAPDAAESELQRCVLEPVLQLPQDMPLEQKQAIIAKVKAERKEPALRGKEEGHNYLRSLPTQMPEGMSVEDMHVPNEGECIEFWSNGLRFLKCYGVAAVAPNPYDRARAEQLKQQGEQE